MDILVLLNLLTLLTGFVSIIILARVKPFDQIDTENIKMNDYPNVSIIVPVRNSESTILDCLNSLKQLDYPNYEIIVVEGNSTDNTPKLVGGVSEIKVINEPKKPEGWVGKPWACYNGYLASKNSVLLFTDADTVHSPKSLKSTVVALDKSSGFLSIMTTQVIRSFWEYTLIPIFLTIYIGVNGSEGDSTTQIANGQYLMFRRKVYEDLGTHKTVSNSIIEDMEFASYAKSKGIKIKLISDNNFVSTRMYFSFRDVLEGFGKNLALGVKKTNISATLKVVIVHSYFIGSTILLVISILEFQNVSIWYFSAGIAILNYLISVGINLNTEKDITGKYSWHSLLFPLYLFMFFLIFWYSTYQINVRKKVVWKERMYKT